MSDPKMIKEIMDTVSIPVSPQRFSFHTRALTSSVN